MEKKFKYIKKINEKDSEILLINYNDAVKIALKSLDGLDECLLNNKYFISDIIKTTQDKLIWNKIGVDLKKDSEICSTLLLRNFINWNEINNELKENKYVLFAASYKFNNQALFEEKYAKKLDLIEFILKKPNFPLHYNIVKYWFNDLIMMEKIVEHNPYYYKDAQPSIRRDIKLAIKAIDKFPHYLGLEKELWKDINILKEIVNFKNINFAPLEIQKNYEIIIPILKDYPFVIYSLNNEVKEDPIIVLHGIAGKYLESKTEENYKLALNDFTFNSTIIGYKLKEKIKAETIEKEFQNLLSLGNNYELHNLNMKKLGFKNG